MKTGGLLLKCLILFVMHYLQSIHSSVVQILKITSISQILNDYLTLREALESIVLAGPIPEPIIYSLNLKNPNFEYIIDVSITMDLGAATLSISGPSTAKIVFKNEGKIKINTLANIVVEGPILNFSESNSASPILLSPGKALSLSVLIYNLISYYLALSF